MRGAPIAARADPAREFAGMAVNGPRRLRAFGVSADPDEASTRPNVAAHLVEAERRMTD